MGIGSVYIPSSFAETDRAVLHEFVRRHSFALLTSQSEVGLVASHLPLLLDAEAGTQGRLLGHMARANAQWRTVVGEVMAVFSGPHAYVSPSWYEEPATVPTWNYVAVHAYGRFVVIEEREELLDILRQSVRLYESGRPAPWAFDESEEHVDRLLKTIVGFRIELTRLEGKWKLNQNHSEDRQRRVMRSLAAQDDENSRAIAALMAQRLG
jgi:transcriptional regulator